MKFWRERKFWIRECFLGFIFIAIGIAIFIKTQNFGRSIVFSLGVFVLIQPFLLFAYFIDSKFGGRGSM